MTLSRNISSFPFLPLLCQSGVFWRVLSSPLPSLVPCSESRWVYIRRQKKNSMHACVCTFPAQQITHITYISHANILATRKQKWESFFRLANPKGVCVASQRNGVWLNGQYCNLCSRGSICPISNGEERGYSLTLDLHQHSARKRIIGKPPSFRDKCPSTRQ